MELEMKISPLRQQYEEYPAGEAEKDDRPLLKSDSSVQYTSVEQIEKTFSAFVRNDTYGTLGIDEISLRQKFLLGFALVTLVPIRLIVGMSVLILYYLICRICTLFSVPNREDDQEDYAHMVGWRRSVIVYCGRILSRAILFTMGFYWIHESYRFPLVESQHNNEDETDVKLEVSERPGTIISNHVSYLDILYHMSSSFPSFVAKISVERLPLVGLISKCLGCIYVQRESKSSDFKGVSGIVTERILTAYQNKDAPMMLLFPEGTTSNGNFLLPFKTGAFLPKVPVLPVILKYPYQRFSPAWESISGVRHVILLLCQFVNHMEVIHLPIYCPSKQEKEDPKLYANNVRSFMATEGNLTLSNLGLAEKRTYMAALNGNGLPNDLRPKAD